MDGPGHMSGTSLKPVDAAVESSQNLGPKGACDTCHPGNYGAFRE